MGQKYVTLGEFSPDEVLPFTGYGAQPRRFTLVDGRSFSVLMDSLRYQAFAKSRACAACGLEGTIMRLEYDRGCNPERPHFNLYAMMLDGSALQMTKRGMHDLLTTMCLACNRKEWGRK